MSERTEGLELRALPATAEGLHPYGHLAGPVAAEPLQVNAGTALRHDIVQIEPDHRPGSRLMVSVFEATPQALPLAVRLMERHPFSQQAIIAMHAEDFILAVCLDDAQGRPDLSSLRAFRFSGGGMIYRRGVWHTPIIGLGAPGRFFVQSWQAGTAQDCEEQAMDAFLIRAE
ncbi:ureidoglycolate lyase [Ancylobacter sp.]|uniref:ureidoglycolate lyase n=1 Tax=Ancylobacter sp. TaxID=1872567 RepID=UPI003D09F851